MGKVKVTFYGLLARITNEKTVEASGSTLRDAIEFLALKYGKQFESKIYDEGGNPRKYTNIYINGKDARFLSHFETKLNEGDEVSIVPAVGGG